MAGYIVCTTVLIVEACQNGNISAAQSNSIGQGGYDFIGSIAGDASQEVFLDSITIQNKQENFWFSVFSGVFPGYSKKYLFFIRKIEKYPVKKRRIDKFIAWISMLQKAQKNKRKSDIYVIACVL